MARTREPLRTVNGVTYLRLPQKTHIIHFGEDIADVADRYTRDVRQPGDIIVVAESPTAISQGRAIPEKDVKIGLLARLLWRGVRKVPYGIGLRSPATMQCAINECGAGRILAACVVGFLGKLVGRRGDFYRVAGMQAATIDAAHTSPVPPYDQCVILGPKDPDGVARRIHERTSCEAAIMDVNDIGGSWVLGASDGVDRPLLEEIMRDNPAGQKDQCTPIVLVRQARREA
ncbi:MAG TPA: coenzyme F420-0:L-glutamate ligase [Sumerlaeia bacterium]|nr:coenzyme F420-0:L-glutamate ligase [Sumerlaeia bacterium]